MLKTAGHPCWLAMGLCVGTGKSPVGLIVTAAGPPKAASISNGSWSEGWQSIEPLQPSEDILMSKMGMYVAPLQAETRSKRCAPHRRQATNFYGNRERLLRGMCSARTLRTNLIF